MFTFSTSTGGPYGTVSDRVGSTVEQDLGDDRYMTETEQ